MICSVAAQVQKQGEQRVRGASVHTDYITSQPPLAACSFTPVGQPKTQHQFAVALAGAGNCASGGRRGGGAASSDDDVDKEDEDEDMTNESMACLAEEEADEESGGESGDE
jgi:hypothetical protein